MVPDDPPTNIKKIEFYNFLIFFFCNLIFFGPDGHLGEFGRSPGPFFEIMIFGHFL